MLAIAGDGDEKSSRYGVRRIGGYRAKATREAFAEFVAVNYASAYHTLSEPHVERFKDEIAALAATHVDEERTFKHALDRFRESKFGDKSRSPNLLQSKVTP